MWDALKILDAADLDEPEASSGMYVHLSITLLDVMLLKYTPINEYIAEFYCTELKSTRAELFPRV